jgi:hypothetical protein
MNSAKLVLDANKATLRALASKQADLCRFSNQPVAEIVQCGEPAFTQQITSDRFSMHVEV